MVRAPCFDSNGMKKGAWSEEEDNKLRAYVLTHGHWNWRLLPKYAGLARCGKSCRLRWVNYLKPGVKRGNFTKQEEDLIINLHAQFGNKWSIIATYLAGRTDNDIKNFWNAHIEKRHKRKVKLHEENLSSASTIKLQEPTLPFDATFSQDLWPDHDHKVCLPPLMIDEEFLLHDRVVSEYVDQLSEYFALDTSSNSQNGSCYDHNIRQQEGGFYDPYVDHFLS